MKRSSLTALSYSPTYSSVTVLSVHVMCATSGVVPQPDTVILYDCRTLLVHLKQHTQSNIRERVTQILSLRKVVHYSKAEFLPLRKRQYNIGEDDLVS